MTRPADLVLVGGTVNTLDIDGSIAEAVAVTGGLVSAVGRDDQIRPLIGPATTVIDLQGRCVIPGLIDSHCHFESAAMDEFEVSFAGVETLREVLDRIGQFAATCEPGEWIRGQMWNPVLQLRERRAPSRLELDRAAGGRPVFLPEGHAVSVSTAALELAGLDPSDHDGRLVEGAVHDVAKVVPEWTAEDRAKQLAAAMRVLSTQGITSVVGGAMAPRDVDVIRALASCGESTVRIAAMVTPTGELNPSADLKTWRGLLAEHPHAREVGGWVLERGVKLQIDGGMTLGTAATSAPYASRDSYHGELFVDKHRFAGLVDAAHQSGWPTGVHAVGDAAIDLALDVYAATQATRHDGMLPDVLIHASLMRRDQLARARDLGLQIAAQTPFLWRNRAAIAKHLGDERADNAVPTRDFIDVLGLDNVAAGTDYPINDLDPFQNFYAMVTRKNRDGETSGVAQAVNREQALRLYTTSGAAHTGESAIKGSLAVGMLADLAVLDTNPLTASDDELRATRTLMTVVDGRIVHNAGDLA
ncbi:amidohydrolase [Saccharopolyspora pogona]|uniref:amidohydrolase n=1 Tax=Saccharopolyspora pogona TaxID=333966 RepID=UPI001682F757|nr:amidohydrolase [Saccharopolyspora pogona]